MAAKIISTGGKGLDDYFKKIKGLSDNAVTVGIHKSSGNHDDSDLTVAEVAAKNEFGDPFNTLNGNRAPIPERSFIRSSMRENRLENILIISKIIKRVSGGKGGNYKQAMGKFGLKIQNDIQKKIVAIKYPENSPYTIKKKRSSNPLIDTGQMLNSVRWEYVKNDN